jgi:hypothetical protein
MKTTTLIKKIIRAPNDIFSVISGGRPVFGSIWTTGTTTCGAGGVGTTTDTDGGVTTGGGVKYVPPPVETAGGSGDGGGGGDAEISVLVIVQVLLSPARSTTLPLIFAQSPLITSV